MKKSKTHPQRNPMINARLLKFNNLSQMFKSENSLLIILIFISIIIRVLIMINIAPSIRADTSAYTKLANYIWFNNFSLHDGLKTPGYSLIIILAGLNLKVTTIIQHFMGILNVIMLYRITEFFTNKNKIIPFIVGILYTTYITFLAFESTILSELVTIFWILAVFYLIIKILDRLNNKLSINFLIILMGLTSALLILTRPLYMYLPILIGAFLIILKFFDFLTLKRLVYSLILFFGIQIIITSGWKFTNYLTIGKFTNSTFLGYGLTNKIGSYIESYDESHNKIVEIFIKERDKRLSEGEQVVNTIWHCYEEMLQNTGLSHVELGEELKSICFKVIKNNPLLYFKSVIISFINFWKPYNPQPIKEDSLPLLYITISKYQQFIFFFIEILFFIIPIIFLKYRKRVKLSNQKLFYILLGYFTIFSACILQALVEHGQSRYSIPTDPLLLMLVIVSIFIFYNSSKSVKSG